MKQNKTEAISLTANTAATTTTTTKNIQVV
jgi:hypothetical protein